MRRAWVGGARLGCRGWDNCWWRSPRSRGLRRPPAPGAALDARLRRSHVGGRSLTVSGTPRPVAIARCRRSIRGSARRCSGGRMVAPPVRSVRLVRGMATRFAECDRRTAGRAGGGTRRRPVDPRQCLRGVGGCGVRRWRVGPRGPLAIGRRVRTRAWVRRFHRRPLVSRLSARADGRPACSRSDLRPACRAVARWHRASRKLAGARRRPRRRRCRRPRLSAPLAGVGRGRSARGDIAAAPARTAPSRSGRRHWLPDVVDEYLRARPANPGPV